MKTLILISFICLVGCIKPLDVNYEPDPHKVTFDFTDTGLYFRAYTKIDTVIYGPVNEYKF